MEESDEFVRIPIDHQPVRRASLRYYPHVLYKKASLKPIIGPYQQLLFYKKTRDWVSPSRSALQSPSHWNKLTNGFPSECRKRSQCCSSSSPSFGVNHGWLINPSIGRLRILSKRRNCQRKTFILFNERFICQQSKAIEKCHHAFLVNARIWEGRGWAIVAAAADDDETSSANLNGRESRTLDLSEQSTGTLIFEPNVDVETRNRRKNNCYLSTFQWC